MPNHMCMEESAPREEGKRAHTDELLQSISWGGVNRSGKATLAIKSAHFGTYLRMDGRGTPPVPGAGGGIVNCQAFIGIWELFRFVPQRDGSVAIQSVYSGHWLRMAGDDAGESGGGVVNCQSFVGDMEKFHIEPLEGEDGAVAFRSSHFGTYLRMDAINVATQPITSGGGRVNCSKAIRSWEKFSIEVVRPVVALKSVSCKLFLRVDCCHSSNKSEWKISGQTYLGAWEKFILVRSDDGLVNLKSEAFQTFITITDSGLQVTEEARTKFAIVFLPDGQTVFEHKPAPDSKPVYLGMSPEGNVIVEHGPIHDTCQFSIIVDT